MVVGIVDEHGPAIISAGEQDNGTDRLADGHTLFCIQSATYTFFCLLLEDMVEHGEVQPDAPVANYLPASVHLPTYHDQQITVRQVAKETSGLRPPLGDALDPTSADNPLEGLTPEKFYAVLTNCHLTSAPGTTHLHGGIDRAVLNQALTYKAGTSYESLLRLRVFRALDMNDTSLTLAPEQESRFAPEHSKLGYALPRWREGDFLPMAGIYSSGNDLLKFLAASLPESSRVAPLWKRTVANFAFAPRRPGLLNAGGGWWANGCYLAFDEARRRGVVVLANAYEPRRLLGLLLLESEWESARRPSPAKVSPELCASYAGQYQRSPDNALGRFVLRHYVFDAPHATIWVPAGVCLAVLGLVLWRIRSNRKRCLVVGYLALAFIGCCPFLPLIASRVFCARLHPGIAIRSESDRLFAETTGSGWCTIEDWPIARAWNESPHPLDILFPPVPVELMPKSNTDFFERLSGVPLSFSVGSHGTVSGLTLHYHGRTLKYERLSALPPKRPEPVKPPLFVKLDTNQLDACVGGYEMAPSAGFPKGLRLKVWRDNDQLFGRAEHAGEDRVLLGTFPLFPRSETNFLEKLTGAQFNFTKDAQGHVTALAHHPTGATLVWFPDWDAKRIGSAPGK